MVIPFPLSRQRGPGGAYAHHNLMDPFTGQRSGRYRPKVVTAAPRRIPDERFDELFAGPVVLLKGAGLRPEDLRLRVTSVVSPKETGGQLGDDRSTSTALHADDQ